MIGYEPGLEEVIKAVTTHPRTARSIVGATTVDQTAGQALAAVETAGLPTEQPAGNPTAPQNLNVTVGIKLLMVWWADPIEAEYVSHTIVRATRVSNGAVTLERTDSLATLTLNNLVSGAAYKIEAWHVDFWGRSSAITNAGQHTPSRTVAEEINLEQIAFNERLIGQLPNANLAPIGDSSKFAEGVVNSISLAAGANANVLPWQECEWENWANTQAWPPPGILAVIPAGHSAVVTAVQGRKWLTHQRTTSTASTIIPFADWSSYAVPGAEWAIYSGYVRSAGGVPQVRVIAYKASDAAGTGAEVIAPGTIITVTSGKDHRVFVKFQRDPAKPFIRFGHQLLTDNTAVRWTRQQLEVVEPTDSEPGPYSIPAATFGAISGRLLGVMDAAIVNAVIGTAAINDAKISDLKAGTIIGGTINTTTITVSSALRVGAGGSFALAGSVYIDETGLNLIGVENEVENPDVSKGSKITPRTAVSFSSYGFYQNPNTNNRGASIVGAGTGSTGYNGAAQLTALPGPAADPNGNPTGRLLVRSRFSGGRGYVNLINTEILATNSFSGTMAANTILTITLNVARRPFRVHVQVSLPGSDNWTPCMEGTGHGIRVWFDTATTLKIANDNGANRGISMVLCDGGV